LKLFDRLKTFGSLQKVVYAGAGCAVAAKTFDQAIATAEDAPVSLLHDTPYSISKLVGEMYGNYYFLRYGLPLVTARFQNVYEWVETIEAGWNRLWKGPDYAPRREITAFGDGHAAEKAVELLVGFLKCQPKAGSAPLS